ncbi:hypothetical protein BM449_09465 [Synechococcus sp. SynAce01]|nr:hypothetical protein BM449_09465 [Synechococcus sp. SynAce01]
MAKITATAFGLNWLRGFCVEKLNKEAHLPLWLHFMQPCRLYNSRRAWGKHHLLNFGLQHPIEQLPLKNHDFRPNPFFGLVPTQQPLWHRVFRKF